MKIRRLKSRSSTGWCRRKQKPPFGPFGSFYTNAASILIGFILSHQQRPREAESLRTAAMEAVSFGSANIAYIDPFLLQNKRCRYRTLLSLRRGRTGGRASTVVRSWPSFCEWQRRHFLRFEVVWGCFSCLENVAVILDFRAAFIVVYRCLSDLESSSIRFEAVAANTLGIPSFWGCLRRTQSLAGGWKFQWTAAKSSDMSIQLLFD